MKTATRLLLTDWYSYERIWTFSVEMFEHIYTCPYLNMHAEEKNEQTCEILRCEVPSAALWPSGRSAAAVLIE